MRDSFHWDTVGEVGAGSGLNRASWVLVHLQHPHGPVLLSHCSALGREVI